MNKSRTFNVSFEKIIFFTKAKRCNVMKDTVKRELRR